MNEYEKYRLKEEIKKENDPGCAPAFFTLVMVVMTFGIMSFIEKSHARLTRLEKAAGLHSPKTPFNSIPTN